MIKQIWRNIQSRTDYVKANYDALNSASVKCITCGEVFFDGTVAEYMGLVTKKSQLLVDVKTHLLNKPNHHIIANYLGERHDLNKEWKIS